MPSQYIGNPAASQSPSPAPSLGSDQAGDPIGSLPTDGDALNASSVLQALKVPLDWLAFLRRLLGAIVGVRFWEPGRTYDIDALVIGSNHKTYRATGNSTNMDPTVSLAAWELWALDEAGVSNWVTRGTGALSDPLTAGILQSGHAATVSNGYAYRFPASPAKIVTFELAFGGVGNIVIDFADDAEFETGIHAVTLTDKTSAGTVHTATVSITAANRITINVDTGMYTAGLYVAVYGS